MTNKYKIIYNDDNSINMIFNNITIILDCDQLGYLENLHKRFIYDSNYDEYPYYNKNKKKKNIIELLYDINKKTIHFKNNNKFDLRKENVLISYDLPKSFSTNYNFNYKYDKDTNIYSLEFSNINIIVNPEQYTIINNLHKKFIYNPNKCEYPYYNKNYNKCDLLDILYIFKKDNIYYKFLNNNKYDLRPDNVIVYHQYHKIIEKEYNIKQYIPGHYNNNGKDAYIMKNPIWITLDNGYLMYCEPEKICKLSKESYKIIKLYEKNQIEELKIDKKITYYLLNNGYIGCNNNLYIHQIIMNYYGNGKGTINGSVNHKNRNRLDNRLDNLEVSSHQQQQSNKIGTIEGTKRKRKSNAKPLPEGLTQDMMPKYVVYYKEIYNKEKQLTREFFKIEKHPKLTKPFIGSKSNKLTIFQKLESITQKLQELDTTLL